MMVAKPPATCEYCGAIHSTLCPRIKAIEYYPDGVVRRREFHSLEVVVSGNLYRRAIPDDVARDPVKLVRCSGCGKELTASLSDLRVECACGTITLLPSPFAAS